MGTLRWPPAPGERRLRRSVSDGPVLPVRLADSRPRQPGGLIGAGTWAADGAASRRTLQGGRGGARPSDRPEYISIAPLRSLRSSYRNICDVSDEASSRFLFRMFCGRTFAPTGFTFTRAMLWLASVSIHDFCLIPHVLLVEFSWLNCYCPLFVSVLQWRITAAAPTKIFKKMRPKIDLTLAQLDCMLFAVV